MKKYFLLALTILKGLCLIGQIPNPSFETWTLNAWSNPQPQGWSAMLTPDTTASPYTPAYQGTSAMKFENFLWNGNWVDLSVNTGSSSTNYYIPIGPKPTKLFGRYMFYGGPQDRMFFNVFIKSGGNIIGSGTFSAETSVNVYTQFTANINYSSVAVPDSFRINLALGGLCTNSLGVFGCNQSYFIVDDLFFDTDVGINENVKNNPLKIYPNPTNDFLVFQSFDNDIQIFSVDIYDTKAQLVKKHFVNEKIFELNVLDFNSGLYFYKITFNDGKTKTDKFVKQ